MAFEKIKNITDSAVYVSGDDIDTDRIIPARFMKCVTFEGLGEYTFYDVRFDKNNQSLNHPLDQYKNSSILISGNNFGCGSSREHAPQALYYWGIRAVIAESFAEIFFQNCITLGIPCLSVSNAKELGDIISQNPGQKITIDLENKKIVLEDNTEYIFTMPEGARQSLINGTWDPLQELLKPDTQSKIEEKHIHLPMASL